MRKPVFQLWPIRAESEERKDMQSAKMARERIRTYKTLLTFTDSYFYN